MTRRPRALLTPQVARLATFALLALLGSLQWVRYVDGATATRALHWAAAGTATGALVLLAGRRRPALALAVLAGAALAFAASGVQLRFLAPNHLDEFGNGIARGAEALNSVALPYLGQEPWVLRTVELAGAGLCWLAALLACWPGGRGRVAALCLLLILAASPIVSLGGDSPVLLGLALAVLTISFLFGERLARRPGLSLAVLVAGVGLIAVPVGNAADREEPWFDYRAFSENLAGGAPVTFDWNHQYGPIDWGREGVELFRVRSDAPRYWKVQSLNEFDGRLWTSALRRDLGDVPEDDLPDGPRREEWETTFSVDIGRLQTDELIGSGTTLAITDATQAIEPDIVPGQFIASDNKALSNGDSYTARAYVPEPTADELSRATVGADARRAPALYLDLELRQPRVALLPGTITRIESTSASVRFPPFETGIPPTAVYRNTEFFESGAVALRRSYYERTWRLAQRLKRRSKTAYEYVLAVNNYLSGSAFQYTERPPLTPEGEVPLEDFLFDSRRGYCQQFSGAMALLLRMGGVPARVATGFTPGGQPPSGEWVVRDTDAHSWVEVWFDRIGWVTFDPTPAATPARSQTAAIRAPTDASTGGPVGDSDGAVAPPRASGPAAAGGRPVDGTGLGSGGSPGDDGTPWLPLAVVAVLAAAAAAALVLRRRGTPASAESAVSDLERALRRAGRSIPSGMTLTALESRLGVPGDSYLGALRSARYRPGAPPPTPRQRAAFRKALARALGPAGRLRALYALPPNLPRRPR